MKVFRRLGIVVVAVLLAFGLGCCDSDDDKEFSYVNPYHNYPQLIVGKWFNFTPEASMFLDYKDDASFGVVGYDQKIGWMQFNGTYVLHGNNLILTRADGKVYENKVELSNDKFIFRDDTEFGDRINYRVKESFDITGNYTYLNSAVRVVPAEGKSELKLPEGVIFQGKNSISVDAMQGDRIVSVMQKFFAAATFAEGGKLKHVMDGEEKNKTYTLNGNNLVFNLYEGSDAYKVNATSFPDEDGDRLFIIIPKQAAWLGGMVELVEKDNEGLVLSAAQIAELEQEFMNTFETFTVILSLSKK